MIGSVNEATLNFLSTNEFDEIIKNDPSFLQRAFNMPVQMAQLEAGAKGTVSAADINIIKDKYNDSNFPFWSRISRVSTPISLRINDGHEYPGAPYHPELDGFHP